MCVSLFLSILTKALLHTVPSLGSDALLRGSTRDFVMIRFIIMLFDASVDFKKIQAPYAYSEASENL